MRFEPIDAVILAGGLGTRLRGVLPDIPKPLAPIGDRPFLEILLRSLDSSGLIRSVVLAIGYRAERFLEEFRRPRGFRFPVACSVEESPLGTAGAIRKALPLVQGGDILVMNGDSFCEVGWGAFLSGHRESGACATIALARCADPGRYGTVTVDPNGLVTSFREKEPGLPDAWINAGVYIFRRSVLDGIPPGQVVSLEREVLPSILSRGIRAYRTRGLFIDIGVPEDYERACEALGF